MKKKEMCCLCGTVNDKRIKLINGCICQTCLNTLPPSVRNSIEDLTTQNIADIKKACKKAYDVPWLACMNLGMTNDSVIINGFKYKLSNLESFSIRFHPTKMHKVEEYAYGYLSVQMVIKEPHIFMEEKISNSNDDTICKYIISGTFVTYNFSQELIKISCMINEAIKNKTYDIEGIREKMFHAENIKKEEKRGRQNKKAKNKSKKEQDSHEDYVLQPIERARIMFGFSKTYVYTKDELIKQRNKIMVENSLHPDDGGNPEEFKEFMNAYNLLLKFAKD